MAPAKLSKSLTCPIEVSDSDEPLVIEAKISRVGAAIGLWIFGGIWTGICSAIIYFTMKQNQWFPGIILSIFFLIGLAILAFAVYATLQIFNPTPVLVLSQQNVYPGSEFEVSWMFRGNTKAVRKLKITMRGKEVASYRQGTNTRKEEAIFFQKTLVETADAEQIAKGFQLVSLPVNVMHSFQGGNNTIEWQLTVEGVVLRWPDIKDEFPMTVLAPNIEPAGAV